MREKRLVLEGSPCDTNLYPDGPKTVTEAKTAGPVHCPHRHKCEKELTGDTGLDCIMLRGLEVAKNALKEAHSIDKEMRDFGKFFESHHPPKGFVYSANRKEFEIIKDRREIIAKIREFAKTVFDEGQKQDVGDGFEDVVAHAMTPEGIDLRKMEELEGRFGTNAGRGCDVKRGPCSCGAWH